MIFGSYNMLLRRSNPIRYLPILRTTQSYYCYPTGYNKYDSSMVPESSAQTSVSSENIIGVNGAGIIYNRLLKHGVKNTFIYSGGAIMPLINEFYNQDRIKYYINTNEHNCGFSAVGYAKSSSRVGVAIVTSGPGLTNLVTPMLDAQNDSVPMVVLSGQVGTKAIGTNAFQEAPSVDITKSFTKWSYQIDNVGNLGYIMDKAFYIAQQGKQGVVHLDLPKDILTTDILLKQNELVRDYKKEIQTENDWNRNYLFWQNTPHFLKTTDLHKYMHIKNNTQPITTSNNSLIPKIGNIMNKSNKPIFYIGKGCNNYSKELINLVLKSNIPITTTIHAMGIFPESSPLSLEFLGMHGNMAANYAMQEADTIIAIGTRFDDRCTGNIEKFAPIARGEGGTIVHCDIDEGQIDKVKKIVDCDYKVNMDAGDFIRELIKYVEYNDRCSWLDKIGSWKKDYPFKYEKKTEDSEFKLKTQQVLECLNTKIYKKGLEDKIIVTTGVGNHQMYASQFIKWHSPKSFISSGSLGVMGSGLPYAIGVAIANPDKMVICIDGDGSFNMSMNDLKTVAEYKLPIKILVMNDRSLSMVRAWEQLFYDGRHVATDNNRNPNYEKLGKIFGLISYVCSGIKGSNYHTGLDKVLDKILDEKMKNFGMLVEFQTIPDLCLPLVAPGKGLDDMIYHKEGSNDNDIHLDNHDVPS